MREVSLSLDEFVLPKYTLPQLRVLTDASPVTPPDRNRRSASFCVAELERVRRAERMQIEEVVQRRSSTPDLNETSRGKKRRNSAINTPHTPEDKQQQLEMGPCQQLPKLPQTRKERKTPVPPENEDVLGLARYKTSERKIRSLRRKLESLDRIELQNKRRMDDIKIILLHCNITGASSTVAPLPKLRFVKSPRDPDSDSLCAFLKEKVSR